MMLPNLALTSIKLIQERIFVKKNNNKTHIDNIELQQTQSMGESLYWGWWWQKYNQPSHLWFIFLFYVLFFLSKKNRTHKNL